MALRVLVIVVAALTVSACTSTSDGPRFNDRPISPQGKVPNQR